MADEGVSVLTQHASTLYEPKVCNETDVSPTITLNG